jgi:SAM-dependent methyltransferase
MADAVYFAMQRTAGNLRPGQPKPTEWFGAGVQLASWMHEAGRQVDGACFLEIGTGRQLSLPTALWLLGAERTITVDLNRYLSGGIVAEMLGYAQRHASEIEAVFGPRREGRVFAERWRRLRAFSGSLQELMALMHIEYLAPADARRLPIPAASVDCHFSHTVFEHVPATIISGMLDEARRVLKPTGVVYHVIDPSDHFSHEDPAITAVNFLQFSDRQWQALAGNKFMYHNRLRASEHRALFEAAGVSVLKTATVLDPRSVATLSNGFPLHAEFSDRPVEDLATRNITVLGEFAAARSASDHAARLAQRGA